MKKLFTYQFKDGDVFNFGLDTIDGIPNLPCISVMRMIHGKPRNATISLIDTDAGVDLCDDLVLALGGYIEEKEASVEAVKIETDKG